MEEQRAIRLATLFAKQQGYDVCEYDISAEATDTGWEIDFVRKSETHKPRPGDFFTICVDRESEAVRILHGK